MLANVSRIRNVGICHSAFLFRYWAVSQDLCQDSISLIRLTQMV
jgi:hypothetical protein